MIETKHQEPQAEPEKPTPRAKSKGEKVFDRVVYGGLAALGTFIVTVPVTYLLKYHGRVAPHFERAVEGLHRLLGKVGVQRATSDQILTTTALMQGGNLMLLPIGVLEKHKVPIVSGLNTAMGDPTPPEQIEKAPKQTWWSLIESRAVAWLTVFGAFKAAGKIVPNTLTTFEDEVGQQLCKLMNKQKTQLVNGKTVETMAYQFGKIGALDFFASIAAATLLYIGGHFFARRHEEKKEQRELRQHHVEGGTARPDAPEQAAEVSSASARASVSGAKAHEGRIAAASVLAQTRIDP